MVKTELVSGIAKIIEGANFNEYEYANGEGIYFSFKQVSFSEQYLLFYCLKGERAKMINLEDYTPNEAAELILKHVEKLTDIENFDEFFFNDIID